MADTKHSDGDYDDVGDNLDEKHMSGDSEGKHESAVEMADVGEARSETYKPKNNKNSKKTKKKKGKGKKERSRDGNEKANLLLNDDGFDEEYDVDIRADDKIKEIEESVQTTFRFRISNLRLKLIGKKAGLPPIFIEFEVGGLSVDRKSDEVKEKKVVKASKDGKDKAEVTIPVPRVETNILIPSCTRFFTRVVKVEGGQGDEIVVKFPGQELEGLWTGTYASLARETLSIRVWHTSPMWLPNRIVGYHELSMLEVARTQVEREQIIYRWTENNNFRAEGLAILNFKFELEEIFDFHISLSKWKVELEDEESLESEVCNWFPFCKSEDAPLVIGFQMANTAKLCSWITRPLGLRYLEHQCIPLKDLYCCNMLNIFCCCGYECPWLFTSTHVNSYTNRDSKNMYITDPSEEETAHLYTRASCGLLRKEKQTLHFYGTRSALEDEFIDVYFWKGSCCYNQCSYNADFCWDSSCCCCMHGWLLGEARENLQGKLDYGYLILYDTEMEKSSYGAPCRLLDGCLNEEPITLAPNVKGVIKTLKEPRYRQLGNLGRPTGGNKWFRFEKNTLYLCVCVVRAKGLVSLTEYKETLNPSVSVDWAQIRREVDPKEDNPDPFWQETVFFKVDCPKKALKGTNISVEDLKTWRGSKVVVNVWDSTGFAKAPLGFCELDFETIFYNRKPKMVESTLGKSGLVSRYVYWTKQKLIDPKLEGSGATNMQGESLTSDRHVELMVWFEMGNGHRVGPARKPKKRRNAEKEEKQNPAEANGRSSAGKKMIRDGNIDEKKLKRARDFWLQALDSVPEFNKRTFAFCGIDEYSGNIYYLPTFLSVMVPPAEIKTDSDLLYYVTSVETVLRKSGDNYLQAKERQARLNKIAPGLRIWADPWYFLDKRRGDHRDHAILLCNFLLGQKKDAYVCVGRAASRHGEQEHVWVMTLEDHDETDGFPQTVRFWETAVGRTYVRMNRRIRLKEKKRIKIDEIPEDDLLIEQNLNFATAHTAAQRSDEEFSDEDGDYSTEHTKKVSKIQSDRERQRFQYRLRQKIQIDQDEEKAERWQKVQERHFDNSDGQQDTPYTGIDVVFNNKNVFANLQKPHPQEISFDFSDPLGWRSFRGREKKENGKGLRDDGEKYFWRDQLKTIKQFYPDKTMIGTKAQEQVVMIRERELIKIVEGAMQGYREFRSDETSFMKKFPFQDTQTGEDDTAIFYIQKRLENECRFGMRDDLLTAREIRKIQRETLPTDQALLGENEIYIKELENYKEINLVRQVWRKDIKESVSKLRRYEEILFCFKHADSSRISDTIVDRIADKFLHIPTKKNPKFAVGAKIHRLPGYISPVRVLVCVIYDIFS